MELIFNIVSTILFLAFIAFALWFGAAILIVIFICATFLSVYIVLRSYYLRWKYGANVSTTIYETHIINERGNEIGNTTIIDAEYKDITENKNE